MPQALTDASILDNTNASVERKAIQTEDVDQDRGPAHANPAASLGVPAPGIVIDEPNPETQAMLRDSVGSDDIGAERKTIQNVDQDRGPSGPDEGRHPGAGPDRPLGWPMSYSPPPRDQRVECRLAAGTGGRP
jgi:hypothetical protein